MIISDVDAIILREFAKLNADEYTTTWKIMKKVYPDGNNSENMKIKKRIEKLLKYGFFVTEGRGEHTKVYILDKNKVRLKKFKFPDSNSSVDGLCIRTNCKWQVIEV